MVVLGARAFWGMWWRIKGGWGYLRKLFMYSHLLKIQVAKNE